jgi:hypothetical protein
MTNLRVKSKIDAVLKTRDFARLLGQKLRLLRTKILRPRVIINSQLLTSGRRRLFRAGLILRRDWYKTTAIFASGVILLFGALFSLRLVNFGEALSKQILGTATTGFELLKEGNFDSGLLNFEELINQIRDSNDEILKILDLAPAGLKSQDLENAADQFVSAFKSAQSAWQDLEGAKLFWDSSANSSGLEFYRSLRSSRAKLAESLENLDAGLAVLKKINFSFLPLPQLDKARNLVFDLGQMEGLALNLLGGQKKTYLLAFQNNDELRATGGFIGTYGLLEFANGQMKIRKIESIYALDGQLKEKIAAPGALQRQVAQYWGLRDSNWFADFPASSRKMLEFLEKEGGILGDGVIALTPDVFEKLLAITGPIAMPEYGVTLTADNFREIVQYKTSLDYDKELNQPKKFLADFAPRFLEKLADLPSGDWVLVLDELFKAVRSKNLLLFSLDPALEQEFRAFHADGGIWPTDGDYLAIYHSNVGGGKTDQEIKEQVEKSTSVLSDGTTISRLKIIQTNEGYQEKFFPRHLDFLRILVPSQAKLLSASGFDDFELLPSRLEGALTDPDLAALDAEISRDEKNKIYIGREAGYAMFANWVELLPGQTKTVELVYETPPQSSRTYAFLLQKQPGAKEFEFSLQINYFAGRIKQFFPASFAQEGDKITITQTIQGDRFYGVVGE